MKYFFFTVHKTAKRDTVTAETVLPVLHSHTAYFKQLGAGDKCVMAGPFVDQTDATFGSGCYVLKAENEGLAREMADADPLVSEGYYSYAIREWSKVVPE